MIFHDKLNPELIILFVMQDICRSSKDLKPANLIIKSNLEQEIDSPFYEMILCRCCKYKNNLFQIFSYLFQFRKKKKKY